ncbi:MAG TPA: hypothetical protein PLS77_12710 [Anaerolineaceae bacterium]|nr:hypothetical protein [Anaerolineaceae bacterium]HQH36556.1 hypothetical protein [Anaerolineaceae bacterium]HQJ02946.1 hypothetical protein [Anaerolineaceae bacterium]
MAKQVPFIRAHCESCGGPLGTPDETGRVICPYCGTVYISTGIPRPRKPETPKPPTTPNRVEVPQPAATPAAPASGPKRTFLILLLAGGGIALLLLCLFSGLFQNPGSKTSREERLATKPSMLAALPAQPVLAGAPVYFAEWGLVVDPEVSTSSSGIEIELELTNYADQERVFRYVPNGIRMMDDRGNTYLPNADSCDSDLLHLEKQASLDSGKSMTFSSGRSWCSSNGHGVPVYAGTIPLDARRLYLYFDNFGPFNGLQVEIGL